MKPLRWLGLAVLFWQMAWAGVVRIEITESSDVPGVGEAVGGYRRIVGRVSPHPDQTAGGMDGSVLNHAPQE